MAHFQPFALLWPHETHPLTKQSTLEWGRNGQKFKESFVTNCRGMRARKTSSCRHVRYFGTLFWDDITKVWDEKLL